MTKGTQWHVVNTRPLERAQSLSHALLAQGYMVTELPLLELVAEILSNRQLQQLAQIIQSVVVIVVSPTAATLGLSQLKQLGIDAQQLSCQWIAVGAGTASILQQAGLQPLSPMLESSEGILSLPLLQQLPAQSTIMFWRGHGGRQLVLQTLAQAEHQTISINLYRRQLPASAASQYQMLLHHRPQVLLISSGVSWQNWLTLGEQFGQWLYPAYILVLGERIWQRIQADIQQLQHVGQPVHTQVILLKDLSVTGIVAQLEILRKCQQT